MKFSKNKKIVFFLSLMFIFSNSQNLFSMKVNYDSSIDRKVLGERMENIFNLKPIKVQLVEALQNDLQIFKPYLLINIFVSWTISTNSSLRMQHWLLPSGGPVGLFAYNGTDLMYLSQSPENLQKLLAQFKIISNSKIDVFIIAKIITLTQIDKKNNYCDLLNSANDIHNYERSKKNSGYIANRNKVEKLKNIISKPHWENEMDSKILVFYCLDGWMHKKQTVKHVKVDFDKKTSAFTINQETMEDNVFDQVPGIEY